MTFGLSGAALAGIAVGGATLVSGLAQADAAQSASETQAGASQAGIEEQRRQFDAVQKLLQPYVQAGQAGIAGLQPYTQAGQQAFGQQQALIGLQGPQAQQQAIEGLQGSQQFQALQQQGENAILQNASATGGLRGGNVQGALAQFRPALLSSLINQQYERLGKLANVGQITQQNLASLGQASAAGVGTAGLQTGQRISGLLGEQGANIAGGEIAQGKAFGAIPQAISGGLGLFSGLGGKF